MRKALQLSAFALALVAQPALADTIVAPTPRATFTPGVFAPPAYTTAAIFQNFEEPANYLGPDGTTGAAVGGVLGQGFSGAAQGQALRLLTPSASYTLNFITPMQFVSFASSGWAGAAPGGLASATLRLNFANATSTTINLADLNRGVYSFGLFAFDMRGESGITSLSIFGHAAATRVNFRVDSFAAAAPEPATWAMMIFGFGVVGASLRRRRPALSAQVALA